MDASEFIGNEDVATLTFNLDICPTNKPETWNWNLPTCDATKAITPLKTNMSPENQWLEDVFPTKIVPF